MLSFCFQTTCWRSLQVLMRCTNSKQEGLVHVWNLKDWNFLALVTVLPVTTDVGGTSQVNVMMVPSWLGNKLESEIDGPG